MKNSSFNKFFRRIEYILFVFRRLLEAVSVTFRSITKLFIATMVLLVVSSFMFGDSSLYELNAEEVFLLLDRVRERVALV